MEVQCNKQKFLILVSKSKYKLYILHISPHRISPTPRGMLIPLTVHVAMEDSNIHAKKVFNQCFLLPHIIVSTTAPTPLRKKNSPIRIVPSWWRMGWSEYIWKTLIRLNAPITPMGRAITSGTPYFGRPYLRGQYAREVQGDANALCHVFDLLHWLVCPIRIHKKIGINTKSLTEILPYIVVQTKQD